MSWKCKQCETLNSDESIVCEVCDAVSPHISNFDYDDIVPSKPTTLRWTAEACDHLEIENGNETIDATNLNEIEIQVSEEPEIVFKMSNENADRIYKYQLNRYKLPQINSIYNKDGEYVYIGDSASLKWDVLYATSVSINGIDVTGEDSLNDKIIPSSTGVYVLVARNHSTISSKTLNLHILNAPSISFKCDKRKLKKGKDNVVCLTWQIENASSASLSVDGKIHEVNLSGQEKLIVDHSTTCTLIAVGLDKKRSWKKTIHISVYKSSEVSFEVNRHYTLSGVPVTLSWDVKYARNVALIGVGDVESKGNLEVCPNQDTDYILRVTDAFGQHDEKVSVHMLPLPVITSIQVPAPEIKSTMNVSVAQPTFNCDVRMPEIRFETVDLKLPHVPFLKEAGLYVDLINKEKQNLGMWSKLKSLFQHYNHKAKEYESSK